MAGSLRQRPDRGPDAWELRIDLGRDQAGKVASAAPRSGGTSAGASEDLDLLGG